jgi:ABC-2 type transport system ATP-binding protein
MTSNKPIMPLSAEPALQVQGLRKAYGSRTAVESVSFQVMPGQVLGLLGPNGAGKSTTVGMICGLTTPDAGEIRLRGGLSLASDEAAYKHRLGLVPQDLALYEELPAHVNVELFGSLYGLSGARLRERTASVLALVGLADRAGDKPATFSGGMKRRLHIACALVHDPEVILLDEPTAGVDPQSRNAIFDNLEHLKAAGKALIYTTHYMEEAERLADHVVIVDHGRVVASGTQAELYAAHAGEPQLTVQFNAVPDAAALQDLPGVLRHTQDATRAEFTLHSLDASAALLASLTARGLHVRSLASSQPSLEDVFLALTGRQLRD